MIFKWEKDYGGMAWTVGVTLGEPGESDLENASFKCCLALHQAIYVEP